MDALPRLSVGHHATWERDFGLIPSSSLQFRET